MATNTELLNSINLSLTDHLARDKDNCNKIDKMYKILVTGNGELPLPEMVRLHGAWIDTQKQMEKEKAEDTKELAKETRGKKWGIIMLGFSQVAMLAGLAVAIVLGLK